MGFIANYNSNYKSEIVIVTRHEGSLPVIEELLSKTDIKGKIKRITHMDKQFIKSLKSGDSVVGILPISLVAELTIRRINYYHLNLSIPAELRGKKLSEREVRSLNPTLTGYTVFAGKTVALS